MDESKCRICDSDISPNVLFCTTCADLIVKEFKHKFKKEPTPEPADKGKQRFKDFGYAHTSDCKFWRAKSPDKFLNRIGLQVGFHSHSCHIDTTDLTVLMFIDDKGKTEFEDFADHWIEKV